MNEKQKELLLKIQETEKALQSLKKELENSQIVRPLEKLTYASSLNEIKEAFRKNNESYSVPLDIRDDGEYYNCGLYLGHTGKWEIVKDSQNAYVLIPKELRKKIDESSEKA